MGRNAIETVLGAVVIVVAALFLAFAYKSADLKKIQGYTVSAYFPMVDGIKEGTDVKMNGVKVGSIASLKLVTAPGPNQFKVDVKMTVLPNILLPEDTIAMVASESLLGGKYLALEVGVEDTNIKTDGTGRITHTQSPMRLDDLIGQLIYGSKKSEGKNDAGAPAAAKPAGANGAPAAATASPAAPPPPVAASAPVKTDTPPAAKKATSPKPALYSPPLPPLAPEPTLAPPDAAPLTPVEPAQP